MNNITGMTRQKGEGYANRNYSEFVSNIMSLINFLNSQFINERSRIKFVINVF